MPKLDPDSVNPKCPDCGAKLEIIPRWNVSMGNYFTWRCPKCTREEESQ